MDTLVGSELVVPKEQHSADSFDAFYRAEHVRTVRRIALIVGSVAAAEDIVHDAMTEVFHRWSHVREPAAYLRRSTMHGAFRWLRRREREPAHGSVPDRPAVAEARVTDLDGVLGGLPDRQRAAVVLRYYDGLTEGQIAAELGCRPGSVGPMLTRARSTLRKEWTT